jgi:hypothetical protein
MNTPQIFLRALLCIALCFSTVALFGQTLQNIEFNANGIMTAPPPLKVSAGDQVQFTVNFDRPFFDKRAKDAINLYLTAIDNITNDQTYGYVDATSDPIQKLVCALGTGTDRISKLYLSADEQNVISQRLAAYYYNATCDPKVTVPDLTSLITPIFSVDIYYYDKLNNLISTTTIPLTAPSGTTFDHYSLCSGASVIDKKVRSIRYEIREDNLLNQLIIKQTAATGVIAQQMSLAKDLKQIKINITPAIQAKYTTLQKMAADALKFLGGDNTVTIDDAWITSANTTLAAIKTEEEKDMTILSGDANVAAWFRRWMWLTKGLPKSDPLDFEAQPLIAGSGTAKAAKVTDKEKALSDMYDNLVAKSAFRLTSTSTLSTDLATIADIKARMKAEAASQTVTTSDIFWYKGLIYCSPKYTCVHVPVSTKETDYMISHDAANKYILMTKPVKEITEADRPFVFIQNKRAADSVNVTVTTTPITDDVGKVTQEFNMSMLADKKASGSASEQAVATFLQNYDEVNKRMSFILSLSAAPKLPLIFAKSTKPAYQTENEIVSINGTPPTMSTYTINAGNADKQPQIYQGQIRTDKLYNIRAKAGMLYSVLDITSYSKNPDNSYTQSVSKSGVDGIFGVEIFPFKTDMRSINICKGRVSPFIFAGFSMKNITGNFYPTVGLEIFSGVAVGYTRQFGQTQVLTGFNGVPQQISTSWVNGGAVSLLIDVEFFTNLFKLGSNKSLLSL